MTCTQSVAAIVTPRIPSVRMAALSIALVLATPIRSREEAGSTLRTFARPPSAASNPCRTSLTGAGSADGDAASARAGADPAGTGAAEADVIPGAGWTECVASETRAVLLSLGIEAIASRISLAS